jgi:hypothetical protein
MPPRDDRLILAPLPLLLLEEKIRKAPRESPAPPKPPRAGVGVGPPHHTYAPHGQKDPQCLYSQAP